MYRLIKKIVYLFGQGCGYVDTKAHYDYLMFLSIDHGTRTEVIFV